SRSRSCGLGCLRGFFRCAALALGRATAQVRRRRRRRRRVRLEEGAQRFRSLELTVHEGEEELVDELVVDGQVGRNSHLVHERIRNAITGLRPLAEELLELLPDRSALRAEDQREDGLRIGGVEKLPGSGGRSVLLAGELGGERLGAGLERFDLLDESRAGESMLEGG